MKHEFIPITQGRAVPASEEDLKKDELGITRPDLHRRIKSETSKEGDEYLPREYSISVQGVDSYRYTQSFLHDEDSTTSEIP